MKPITTPNTASNFKRYACTLSVGILALSAGSVSAMQSQPADTNTSRVSAIATRSLALQPGDDSLISNALGNPIEFVALPKSREFSGQLIVHAKASKKQTASARVSPLTVRSSQFVDEYVVDVPAGMTEGELAAVLMATGDYEFVEPNWTLFPAVVPNDSQYNSSWQHSRIQSASAWDLNTGSSDIIVAICDSGVDLNHPDLEDSLIPGFNAADNVAQANGGDVNDINGHGTFVSGCAAARGNNGTGVVGVGWNFSIMPIRVTNLNNGNASGFDIIEGARWAAENGAHVINASFSGGTGAANQSAAAYVKTHGALLFWSSGNDGSLISPNRPDIVIVGSTTSSDNRSGFSNFGPAVDIVAPGSSVRSTRNGGSYGNGSGTSYASPIATGVGAMIYAVNPDFNGDDVQAILYQSVDDLGATGRDDFFGRGRVNTRNAIQAAQSYIRPTQTPLSESFESNSWEDVFVASSGAIQTAIDPQAPQGTSVLVLDGTDIAETVPLAARTGSTNYILSFALNATDIEPGETLEIQFLEDPSVAGANTWTTIHEISGEGGVSQSYIDFALELPSEYKWHGSKLRFVSNASDSSDTWSIDSFSIDTIVDSVAPLEENFESGIASVVRWTSNQDTEVSFADNNFSLVMTDADLLESRDIPLDQFGIVPAYIRFDAWIDNQALPGDELIVEVLNIVDNYEVAGTIDASELTSSPQAFEINVPITAIAIADMRLRLRTNTVGAFHLDNIYVGVDELVAGCNDADIAEPFGTLNFFDVSAFLSAFSAEEPEADLTGDGTWNFFDVSDFLTTFNTGCP